MRDTSALPMVYARFGCVDIGLIPARCFKQHLGVEDPETLGVVLAGGAVPTCAAGQQLCLSRCR
jgi:hypothetical protein